MAGLSWFELDVDFHDHPKTVALQVALKNPLAEAYVSRIWAYCYDQAIDRFAAGEVGIATIERAARWKGKHGQLVRVLLDVGYLDDEGGVLVAHGVKERLGPHLAARAKAAARQQRRRDKVEEGMRGHAYVTRDEARDAPRTSTSYPDKDKDRDHSEITIVPDPQPTPCTPPPTARDRVGGGGLDEFRGELAARLGLPRIGLGDRERRDEVVACFGRWLRLPGGEEAVLAECVDLAREQHVTPGHLTWWVGWLDTVPDAEVERVAANAANSREAAGGES